MVHRKLLGTFFADPSSNLGARGPSPAKVFVGNLVCHLAMRILVSMKVGVSES